MRNRRIKFILMCSFILVSGVLSGCGGGGGGGGSFNGPAQVRISANPGKIDSGDRTTVTIQISEVNEKGIMLKVRTPLLLTYVVDSGSLTVDGININLDPDFYLQDTTYNYLVYFLSRDLFGENNFGEITVVYQGAGEIKAGTIDVDPDIDDPLISNTSEFSVKDPKFSSEGSQKIVVKN